MSRTRTFFECSHCGASVSKWQGKCPQCGSWNTLNEKTAAKQTKNQASFSKVNESDRVLRLGEIAVTETTRFSTHDPELDRVLGGGLVPGALTLIGGEPGIGKSTLMLQISLAYKHKNLYISGEESAVQIRLRQQRMEQENDHTLLLPSARQSAVAAALEEVKPGLVVLDSIQTWYDEHADGLPGSLNQIRNGASWMMHWAKNAGVPVFLVGHITKDGQMAGPKALEHMVDTVLYFEGDFHQQHRILRTVKNRFGPSAELGLYSMDRRGLKSVDNPSAMLTGAHPEGADLSGIAPVPVMEGQRPLLVEVQALMSRALFGTPQRTPTGFDLKRMAMLLAVLEKRCGMPVGTQDVFVNIVGGLRLVDPAADLAVLVAMASSFQDQAVPPYTCFCGEVGLSGEIRPVAQAGRRVQEALQRGMKQVFVAQSTAQELKTADVNAPVTGVPTVRELMEALGWS